jgi:hypothetical protein
VSRARIERCSFPIPRVVRRKGTERRVALRRLLFTAIASRALKAEARAPGFNFYDSDGRAVSLSAALAAGPAAVTFMAGYDVQLAHGVVGASGDATYEIATKRAK